MNRCSHRVLLRLCGVSVALAAAVPLALPSAAGRGGWALTESNPAAESSQPTPDSKTGEDQTKLLVVMVRGRFGDLETAGAGIIVGRGPDRLYVATANHVVRQPQEKNITQLEVMLRWLPGEWHPASVTADFDQQLDLAVVSVPNAKALLAQVQLNPARLAHEVKRTNQVFPIGYAGGTQWYSRVTPDLVSDVTTDTIRFETSLELQPGQSGGALVNANYEIVGVVKHYATPHAVAVPMKRVVEWLEQRNYPVFLSAASSAPPPPPPAGRGAQGSESSPPTGRGGTDTAGPAPVGRGGSESTGDSSRRGGSDWLMDSADESRSNFNEGETTLNPPLALVRQIQTGLRTTSLLSVSGRLYVAGENESNGQPQVAAFGAEGNRTFTFTIQTPNRSNAVMALVDGMLVAGAPRYPDLYGVRPETAKLAWKTPVGEFTGRPLLVRGQTVYALSTDALMALDARSGDILWQTKVRPEIAAPVSYGGSVLVMDRKEAVSLAITIAPNGSIERSQRAALDPIADPVTARVESKGQKPSVTMFLASATELAAQTMSSEAPVWKTTLLEGRGGRPSLGAAYGLVIAQASAAGGEGWLLAFDTTTGRSMWRFATGGNGPHGPAIANGVAYVSTTQPPKIFAVSVRDGRAAWSAPLPSAPTGDPIVANGHLYVPAGNVVLVYGPARAGR